MTDRRFNYVKRGYDTKEVDNYIETLEAVLKSYKEKDMAIKNAIVNAQIAADNIIKNAELQANDLKADVIEQMDSFAATISIQKSLIKEFQEDYAYLVQKYVQEYNENEFSKLYDKLDQIDEYFQSLKSPIYQASVEMGEEA